LLYFAKWLLLNWMLLQSWFENGGHNNMNVLQVAKWPKPWWMVIVVGAIAISGATIYVGLDKSGMLAQKPTTEETLPAPLQQVAALGRLEPEGQVLKIAAPLSLDGDRVREWRVKEGDRVIQGQVIAVLDAQGYLQNEVIQQQEQVKVARAKLAQVRAGAKQGEVDAQRAEVARSAAQATGEARTQREAIARLQAQRETDVVAQEAAIQRIQAQLRNAQSELKRHQQLYQAGAISASLFESKQLAVNELVQQRNEGQAALARIDRTGQKQIQEAQSELARILKTGNSQAQAASATLAQVSEVRAVDIQAAQAEVNSAIAALERAKTELAKAYIRAPRAGRILKIQTRLGEKINTNGIAELGQTDRMIAVAEVYQSDISKVKLGQKALLSGQGFSGEIDGYVIEVGRQINQQSVFGNQPGENMDRRVVEVKIRLTPQSSQKVANLTNLQVQTKIQL
jgi:HlyD family secretion protein